jgi:Rieske Fe-S protein
MTGSDMGPAECGPMAVSIGINITDVQMNTATYFSLPQTNIWVCRDDKGVYAMDAECTHLGCPAKPHALSDPDPSLDPMIGTPVSGLSSGFKCNCHGATYDPNGQNPTAPAPAPLNHYLVCTTLSGIIYVDPGQVVDPSIRYHV